MTQVCLSGRFQDAKTNAISPCFAKPTSTVWSLSLPVPTSLVSLGSLAYDGPPFRGAIIQRTFKSTPPRIVALEPPASLLPAVLVSAEHPFPLLSLALPVRLDTQDLAFSVELYFDQQYAPSTPYALTLSTRVSALRPSALASLPIPRPASTLFFQADTTLVLHPTSPVLGAPCEGPATAYLLLLKDLLPFHYTVTLHDGTSTEVLETDNEVIHLSHSYLQNVKHLAFATPPFMLRICNKAQG